MTLAAPWALIGLALLPILWLILRRARTPTVRVLPTLMFLLEEDERAHAAPARRLDVDALLALVALSLIVLAAAGPAWVWSDSGRTVRVVVAGGAPSGADGYIRREAAALDTIKRALAETDRFVLVREPKTRGVGPRPTLDALLGAARAGPASVRIVVSDSLPDPLPSDVRWVAIGDPTESNVGIVAASVLAEVPPRLFVTVFSQGSGIELPIEVGSTTTRVSVPSDGYASTELPFPTGRAQDEMIVRAVAPPFDAVAGDNRIEVRWRPLAVAFDGLPERHRVVVEHALAAVLGPAGYRVVTDDPDFVVSSARTVADGVPTLWLGAASASGGRRPGGDRTQVGGSDPIVRDLRIEGIDWVFPEAPSPADALGTNATLLALAGNPATPIVLADADRRVVVFEPDPTKGSPAPAATAFWPMFIENVVRERFPDAGIQVRGLLDPEASRLGRDVRPFDPAWIAGAPRDRALEQTSWRAPLAGLALALLLVLWLLPVIRQRMAPAPVPGHVDG